MNVDLLRSVDIFAQLSEGDLQGISGLLQERRVGSGTVIFRQGDPGDALYLVASGRVVTTAAGPADPERELGCFSEGQYLGEMALVTGEPRPVTAQAAGDVGLLVLLKEDFDLFLTHNVHVMLQTMKVIAQRQAALDHLPESEPVKPGATPVEGEVAAGPAVAAEAVPENPEPQPAAAEAVPEDPEPQPAAEEAVREGGQIELSSAARVAPASVGEEEVPAPSPIGEPSSPAPEAPGMPHRVGHDGSASAPAGNSSSGEPSPAEPEVAAPPIAASGPEPVAPPPVVEPETAPPSPDEGPVVPPPSSVETPEIASATVALEPVAPPSPAAVGPVAPPPPPAVEPAPPPPPGGGVVAQAPGASIAVQPSPPPLPREGRQPAAGLPAVKKRPPAPQRPMVEAPIDPHPPVEPSEEDMPLGRVFTIFSPKGGVGKTTVAVNLAAALAQNQRDSVALLDLSLTFSHSTLLLNLAPRTSLAGITVEALHRIASREELDYYLTPHPHSSLRLLLGALQPEEGEMVTGEAARAAIDLLRRQFAYVVVDTESYFSDPVLAALETADKVLLLCSPEMACLKDVKECQRLFNGVVPLPQKRVLYVMNGPHPHKVLSTGEYEEALQQKLFAELPYGGDGPLRAALRGEPFVELQPGSPLGRSIQKLAARLALEEAGVVHQERRRGFFR